MGLTGIEIYKKLPKTNCGECGVPTCLAFAMKLATGQAEMSACPYVSEEVKAEFEEAVAPPIRTVELGTGDGALKIGGETVLFRHEKRFENPPAIAMLISDSMSEEEVEARLKRFNELQYDRVGLILKPHMIAIKDTTGDQNAFVSLINKVKEKNGIPLILMSSKSEMLVAGARACAERRPLLCGATKDTVDELANLAKELSCPLIAKGSNLDELVEVTTRLTDAGIKDIVLDSGSREPGLAIQDQVIIRRSALIKKFRPLGFPTITLPCEMTDDPVQESLIASMFVAKYGGIMVLSDLEGHGLFPLLVESMNIYTDPQRPMAVEEKIYEIGGPNEDSPVLLTCNFSLTYFVVSGEVESSRVPSWLLIKDTEGLSVMTAWAAGKFGADTLGPFVNKCGIADRVRHRKLVIPGYAATISGELEEELPDWEILVGPREASHIPAYLRMWKP
jgi:acetyl-CoA decarbonylase/synthase complex subunit gamma